MSNFNDNLSYGNAAEKEFASFFELKKFTSIRIKKSDKNPTMEGSTFIVKGKEYKAADLLISNASMTRLVEVKHTKTCFRNGNSWELWIKYNQYVDYCNYNNNSKLKMIIGWAVDGGFNKIANLESPSGKFYQHLDVLEHSANRIWEPSVDSEGDPLIYWNINLLENLYDWGKKKKN